MGSGLKTSVKQVPKPQYFSNEMNRSSSSLLSESKKKIHSPEVLDLVSYLTGNEINLSFKNGKNRKELILKDNYYKKEHTIEIILEINSQVLFSC